ncbi:hypothetical protein TNCV_2674691 [Trichonephila clavipes]|nr:hypothetical protein TNCV_2674691 [Trichonephila clavipes]
MLGSRTPLYVFDVGTVNSQRYRDKILEAFWLEHRTPDRKAWARCPMPPNTLRVHTENVLIKSVGPKVLWAESRVQGTGEYFPPIQFRDKIVVVPSIVPSGNFSELNRTVTCMELKA